MDFGGSKLEFQFNKNVSEEIKDRLKDKERKCFLFRLMNDNYFKKDVLYVVSYLPENVKPFKNGEECIGFADVFHLARKGNEIPPGPCEEYDMVVTQNPVNERFHIDRSLVLDLVSEKPSPSIVNKFYVKFEEFEEYERTCCQKYWKQ